MKSTVRSGVTMYHQQSPAPCHRATLITLAVNALFFVQLLNAGLFVSATGLDTNTGTIDSPYKTIQKAVSVMKANDTIFVRGGVLPQTQVIGITKKGSDTVRYFLYAYESERPILDFSSMSLSSSNRGMNLSGTYWHIKGIDFKGAGDNGMYLSGSYNIIEFCAFYENRDTGLQLGSGASYNQVINCDSYNNADPGHGNADGFAPKLDVGTGNYFYGCRAWQNSDDGWDGYLRPADSVTTIIENSWCFMNGYLANGTASSGNGNGFKMGGGDNSNTDSLRHNMTLIKCLAFDNRVKGFDQNNNRGSMTLLNCTGFRNGNNFQISSKIKTGSILTVKNSLSVTAAGSAGVASLLTGAIQATNSWQPPFTVSAGDFISLDTVGMRGPRKPDGSLPDIVFLNLAQGSNLIDGGTDIGLPFNGSAPDLGAFESNYSLTVREQPTVAGNYMLHQNYPNPFNPVTTIDFTVDRTAHTVLKIYNTLGQHVATLFDKIAEPQIKYSVRFDASALPSGVYFGALENGSKIQITKMVLQK